MGSHQGPEVPGKVRELVDQLGKVFVNAIMADEAGHDLVQRINESGFEVGIMLEATVALHQKDSEDNDESEARPCPFRPGRTRGVMADAGDPGDMGDSDEVFEWSEEDRALLCNFRISLD